MIIKQNHVPSEPFLDTLHSIVCKLSEIDVEKRCSEKTGGDIFFFIFTFVFNSQEKPVPFSIDNLYNF